MNCSRLSNKGFELLFRGLLSLFIENRHSLTKKKIMLQGIPILILMTFKYSIRKIGDV